MAAMAFICNACLSDLHLFAPNSNTFVQNNASKAYLTDCEHLLCENCRTKCTNKCIVCEKKCNILEVNHSLPRSILKRFMPIHQLTAEYHLAYEFQCAQSAIKMNQLQSQLQQSQEEYNMEKNKLIESQKECEEMKEQAEKAKIILKRLAEYTKNSAPQGDRRGSGSDQLI